MKIKIITILLFTISIFITGCSSENNLINYQDYARALSCIRKVDSEFVINTQEEYQNLSDYINDYISCENFTLPELDFSKITLLGKYTSGSGCSVDFLKRVYKFDSNKTIIYQIEVAATGECDMFVESMNWITISKVPSDYKVKFIVIY